MRPETRNSAMSRGGLFCLGLAMVLIPISTYGTGFREFQDSWLLDRTLLGFMLDPHTHLDSPVGGGPPFTGAEGTRLGGELGQGRLFSMPELEQSHLGVQLEGRLLGKGFLLAGAWEKLGAELYRQDCLQLELRWGDVWGWGIQGRHWQESMASYPVGNTFGLEGQVFRWLNLPAKIPLRLEYFFDLSRAPNFQGRLERGAFLKVTCLLPAGGLVLQLDRLGNGQPAPGLEFIWVSEMGVGLTLRLDPPTGTVGPGVLIRRGPLVLVTSHLVHPDLGQTHRVALRYHG